MEMMRPVSVMYESPVCPFLRSCSFTRLYTCVHKNPCLHVRSIQLIRIMHVRKHPLLMFEESCPARFMCMVTPYSKTSLADQHAEM